MEKQTDKLAKSAKIFVDTFIKEYGEQGAIDKLRELSVRRLRKDRKMSEGDAIWNKGYQAGKKVAKVKKLKTSQFTLAEIEQLLNWEAGNFTGSRRLRSKLLRIKRKLET